MRVFRQNYNKRVVKLWVHWKNARAVPFYYRLGFKLHRIDMFFDKRICKKKEDIIWMIRK